MRILTGMPRIGRADYDAVSDLLHRERQVVTHAELAALGMALSTVTWRHRPGGVWNGILPGVVLAHRGTPTPDERSRAAYKYAGDGAILTGVSALRRFRLRCPDEGEHVLVPHTRRRNSYDFAVVERTRHLPEVVVINGVPCAPPARALVDACRRLRRLDDVRELVSHVLQQGACTLAALVDEVRRAARGRSALSRQVLREMSAGVRSAAEAKARRVILDSGLPVPVWNVEVIADGVWLARVDAAWPALGAVLEIDSMAWHLSAEAYRRTQRRQRRLTSRGVLVLPIAPGDIFADPQAFLAELAALLAEAERRTPPALTYRRAA